MYIEIYTITKDGRVLDGLYSAQTIKVGGHSYLFSMMLDNSERNRREKSQKRMLEFQEILLHAQTLLSSSSQEELDRVLEAMLPRIGQFSGSSQACIFRAAKSGDVAACASEWHSGGGRPPVAMDGLAEVRFRAWAPSLEHGPELCLESEASADARDPRRTLVIPIKGYGILLGALILFDMDGTADWSAEFRRALRFLASSIGAAWTRWSQLAELRYAESKARQMADEAEKENRDKTRFLAFMSHEIRTPMNGIINMTRFLLDTPLDERQRHYGEMLKSSGEVLLRVVNNILDYSKIDAGKLSAEAVRFDPASLAEAVLEPFALQAAGKGVGFEIGIGADIPKAILGDSHRFGQIMSNLAGNAVKFTEKGKVKIALGIESLTQNGVRLRLTVSDTGIGIGAEQLSRIFQPFEQTDRSVTRRFGGTGLGLAIVKELCDILGGRIEVRSTEGVGSEFTAVLPFSLADRPDSGAAGLSRNRIFVDTRVLVVEDQEISSMVAVEMLKNLGVEADIARNGEEALEALEAPAAKHFDLVLMDLRMPVMDGLEATRRIRESNSESIRNIPVIALTGFAMLDDRKASFSAGMNGHINKPLDPLILSDMLALWLPSSKVGSKAWQAADESAAIAAPVDLGLIAACLDELQQPLEDCEPATCMVVLDRLRQTTLPEWSRPAMSALFTMIADFDFKKAGPALAALVAAVKAKA